MVEMAMDARAEAGEAEVTIANGVIETPGDVSLSRAAAAGSLVLSAALLLAGRRKSAVVAAVVAGAITALEEPEMLERWWESVPQYLRRGQDLLVKMEDVVGEISAQGEKLRAVLGRE